MRSVIVALGSFIVGAMCTLLIVSGHHTSTVAQSLAGQPGLWVAPEAVPSVPPMRVPLNEREFTGGTVQLDGMHCVKCLFNNVTFVYAGGEYRLIDAMVSGTPVVILKGAAANTLGVLQFVGAVAPEPRPPLFDKTFGDKPVPITLISSEATTK